MIKRVINYNSLNNRCIREHVSDVIVREELILLVRLDSQDCRNVVYHREPKQPLSVESVKFSQNLGNLLVFFI